MELFDILGMVEPYKVQMKLMSKEIVKFDWDDKLPEEVQEKWRSMLYNMTKLTEVCFPRSVIPYQFNAQNGQIELIGFADAAELCAGACIYIWHLYPNGSITCSLLLSKSKLVDQTFQEMNYKQCCF